MVDTEPTKLTKENWDEVTQTKYNLEFLNDRNAVRAVLYDLLQIDNEIKCTNVEIQNLKKTFDSQLYYLEQEVQRAKSNEYLDVNENNKIVAELVKQIEETNDDFSTKVEKYHLIKEQKCRSVSENVDKFFQLKTKFKSTHQNQVENLRRFRIFCGHAIREAVEIRLKSIDRKFCDEFFYITSCEKNLQHLFTLIDDASSRDETTSNSTITNSAPCSDFFRDFAWMRNEQLNKRRELLTYFKKYLAKDLVVALAAMHVFRPEEPIKFIANYLKHLKQNEFRIIKEEKIFCAGKYGKNLFPENK